MDATTMEKISSSSALSILKANYPDITFQESDSFKWSPNTSTVSVGKLHTEHDLATLLHETGHALAGHNSYSQDIQLLKLEREAWDIAREQLTPLFGLTITDETVEEALDSYRDWLHARSICPECSSTGVQQDESHYRCLACSTIWKVNDARTCQLRRYITK